MAVDWNYYDRFKHLINQYMPRQGEGETMASQAVTAVNKLVYKWYNDGDVYDNTYELEGWWNNLSSYANWLYANMGIWCRNILEGIKECSSDSDYEDLLKELADLILDERLLSWLNEQIKVGSIYNNKLYNVPFHYVDRSDDDDEEEWY